MQERSTADRRASSRAERPKGRPAFLRAASAAARCSTWRASRGDRAPRGAHRARADHGALPGRLGRGREERDQRLRREELPRHLRAAVRGGQRLPLPRRRSRRRDPIAGMAEAVKVALIRDAAFFDWIEAQRGRARRGDSSRSSELVRRCAELHLRHIADGGDPFELGSARPLDFGHWAAHKLEALTEHRLRHGEAVAIGMALDTLLLGRGRTAARRRRRARARAARRARLRRCGTTALASTRGRRAPARARRARRVPRAPRRRADRDAAAGIGAASRCTRWSEPGARRERSSPGCAARCGRPMKLAAPGEPHLTYCTNIHPGETWPEVAATSRRTCPR